MEPEVGEQHGAFKFFLMTTQLFLFLHSILYAYILPSFFLIFEKVWCCYTISTNKMFYIEIILRTKII